MKSTTIAIFSSAIAFCLPAAGAESSRSILTENTVELRETVSPQGFVHPGISCTAETLAVMREKVIAGVSPWVDYFEGMRRTRFADLKERPRFVSQIKTDADIGAFAHDAHLAWAQTILYVVTGDEDYRKTPVEIVRWYGSRRDASFFPRYFADSHIKIGKYVYTLCSAVDILRATTAKDQRLAVTKPMVDALQKHCLYPIRKTCIEKNGYFMNQHSYAIMGYLASTILGDEVDDYKQAVEWTTVNATAANQGRNGSIKQQIRLVTRNDRTGEPVEPRLQVVEMGRDQPHAGGNIDNLLMMAKTIDFQRTKVDRIHGTVTEAADGVSPIHFLDDRLPKGAALFAKYNLGYGLGPWIPTYSETAPDNTVTYNQVSYFGRGSIGGNGTAAGYYYYKAIGLDLSAAPFGYIKTAFEVTAPGREQSVRSGRYLDQIHNYAFDFWIGLPASASEASPDPERGRRALAAHLPPLRDSSGGAVAGGQEIEDYFIDLSAHAQPGDIFPGTPDEQPLRVQHESTGTRYVRMTIVKAPRTIVLTGRTEPGAALRLRSVGGVKLAFYRDEDFARRGCIQELFIPDTDGAWVHIPTDFGSSGLTYVHAVPLSDSATLDLDRIDRADEIRPVPAFASSDNILSITGYVGGPISRAFGTGAKSPRTVYKAGSLPAGAQFETASGAFAWTPTAGQAGEHTFYITTQAGDTWRTRRVQIHVAQNLAAALDHVARVYDASQRYLSATEKAFVAARASGDLAALTRAANALELLNPRLPDGTLDYCKAGCSEFGARKMSDGDPLSWGGAAWLEKSFTLDFGSRFKVKTEAFRLQARDGFPIRVAQSVVYGSNDGKRWTLLTETKAAQTAELQTLPVFAKERGNAYRYLRFVMPPEGYSLFEVAELRIVGERVEE